MTLGRNAYGLCYAGSPLAAEATGCGSTRSADGGTSNLCASGTICVTSAPANTTICSPVCATTVALADGGPGCPASNFCVSVGDFGACFEQCTIGSGVCPANTSCQPIAGRDLCAP